MESVEPQMAWEWSLGLRMALWDGNGMRAGPGSGVEVKVETADRCTDAGVGLRLGPRLWWALGWELGRGIV